MTTFIPPSSSQIKSEYVLHARSLNCVQRCICKKSSTLPQTFPPLVVMYFPLNILIFHQFRCSSYICPGWPSLSKHVNSQPSGRHQTNASPLCGHVYPPKLPQRFWQITGLWLGTGYRLMFVKIIKHGQVPIFILHGYFCGETFSLSAIWTAVKCSCEDIRVSCGPAKAGVNEGGRRDFRRILQRRGILGFYRGGGITGWRSLSKTSTFFSRFSIEVVLCIVRATARNIQRICI